MHMHNVEDTQAASERLKCILPRNENVGHKRECWEKELIKRCCNTGSNQITDY